MICPAIEVKEAERWRTWLAEFGLELYTTVMTGEDGVARIYPLDLKTKEGIFLSNPSGKGYKPSGG